MQAVPATPLPSAATPRRGPRSGRIVAAVAAIVLFTGLSAACAPGPGYFTSLPRPSVATPMRYVDPVFSTITTTSNIVWGSAPDLSGNPVSLSLDMYQPASDTVAQRPVLVVAHSGGFFTHTKTDSVSVDFAKYFASLGYVVISINYRLLAKVDCGSLKGLISDASGCTIAAMAATLDAQAAVRWLRANAATYRIDPNRIVMSGDSAGALMSNIAGILPEMPNNPTDPAIAPQLVGVPLNTANLDQSSQIQAWVAISGGLPPTSTPGLGDKLLASGYPVAPGYLFSGTADTEVPYAWAEATRDELVKAHAIVGFSSLQGAGHVPYAQYGTLFKTQSAYFFYYLMGLGTADQ